MSDKFDHSPNRDNILEEAFSEKFYIGDLVYSIVSKFLPPNDNDSIDKIIGYETDVKLISSKDVNRLKAICDYNEDDLEEDKPDEITINAHQALDFLEDNLNQSLIKIQDIKSLPGWKNLQIGAKLAVADASVQYLVSIGNQFESIGQYLESAVHSELDISVKEVVRQSINKKFDLLDILLETTSRINISKTEIENLLINDNPIEAFESFIDKSKNDLKHNISLDYIDLSKKIIEEILKIENKNVAFSIKSLAFTFKTFESNYLLEDILANYIYNTLSDAERLILGSHANDKDSFMIAIKTNVLLEQALFIPINFGELFVTAYEYLTTSSYLEDCGFKELLTNNHPKLITNDLKRKLVENYEFNIPKECENHIPELLEILSKYDFNKNENSYEIAKVFEKENLNENLIRNIAAIMKNHLCSKVILQQENIKRKTTPKATFLYEFFESLSIEKWFSALQYGTLEDKLQVRLENMFGYDDPFSSFMMFD